MSMFLYFVSSLSGATSNCFVSIPGLANRESALPRFSMMMSAKCNPVPLQRFQAQVGMRKTTKKIHMAMEMAARDSLGDGEAN